MKTITAKFRIVTPMFIAGAKSLERAELRAPSIKGALRFWWRVLAWSRLDGQMEKIRDEEKRLFGSTENAASVCVSVKSRNLKFAKTGQIHLGFARNGNRGKDRVGARYLAYGVMEAFSSRNKGTSAGQLIRPCIDSGEIEVLFGSRTGFSEDIVNAIQLFGLVGGLGSRTRRGFGSITMLEMKGDGWDWSAPSTLREYRCRLRDVMGSCTVVGEPDYSAISSKSHVDVLLKDLKYPCEVLNQFGLKMLDYRSWGQTNRGNRLPSGKPSEKRFKNDHDWFKVAGWRIRNPGFHPERVIFGLPHNYHQNEKDHVRPEKHERRASPLLFHVHQLAEDSYIGVSVLLRSRFLPAGEKIRAGSNTVNANPNWDVLLEFLHGDEGMPSSGKKRFPDRQPVFP